VVHSPPHDVQLPGSQDDLVVVQPDGQRATEHEEDRLFYRPSLGQTLTVFNLGVYFGLRPQLAGAALGQLIDWVATGKVRIPVGHTFAAAAAHRLMETRGSTGKIVLKP